MRFRISFYRSNEQEGTWLKATDGEIFVKSFASVFPEIRCCYPCSRESETYGQILDVSYLAKLHCETSRSLRLARQDQLSLSTIRLILFSAFTRVSGKISSQSFVASFPRYSVCQSGARVIPRVYFSFRPGYPQKLTCRNLFISSSNAAFLFVSKLQENSFFHFKTFDVDLFHRTKLETKKKKKKKLKFQSVFEELREFGEFIGSLFTFKS